MAAAAALQSALQDGKEVSPPPSDKSKPGVIYRVPPDKTPSGKPYIGRTTNEEGPPGRGNRDGRDRKEAEIVDDFVGEREGKKKEQEHIDDNGGVDKLDNKRNEIAPEKRGEYGLE